MSLQGAQRHPGLSQPHSSTKCLLIPQTKSLLYTASVSFSACSILHLTSQSVFV